jgi:hypothetical protein
MTKQDLITKMAALGSDNPTYVYIFGIPCRIFAPFRTRSGEIEQRVQIGSRSGAGVAISIDQAAHRLLEMQNDVSVEQINRIKKWIATPSTVFIG